MYNHDEEQERRAHPENFCNHANRVAIKDLEEQEHGYDHLELINDGNDPEDKICIDCGQIK